jgi:hypothetical protein
VAGFVWGVKGRHFFFGKKNQKTFIHWVRDIGDWCEALTIRQCHAQTVQPVLRLAMANRDDLLLRQSEAGCVARD